MAEYQLSATDTIIRTADGANIPPDPANRDYEEYLLWVAAGGVPDVSTMEMSDSFPAQTAPAKGKK
jgi:hypothetical protein